MSMVIDDVKDEDLVIDQILFQQKNMVNDQINILLKEKRKYKF
jgi:hypothetical protein